MRRLLAGLRLASLLLCPGAAGGAAAAGWLELDEAPCGDVLESSGLERRAWSCIFPLAGGPKRRPADNPKYTKDQLFYFEWFSEEMPQAGDGSGAALFPRAFEPEALRRLLAEADGGQCAPITPAQNQEEFTQYGSETGLLPCKLDLSGSPSLEAVERRAHALLEQWSGLPLEPANQNVLFRSSIVVYPRGSVVHAHLDRPDTHQVSATLLVDAVELQDGWALEVGHYNRSSGRYSQGSTVAIYAQPGDLVAYQGARWEHSRPRPLAGDSYWVIILHYKVFGWDLL